MASSMLFKTVYKNSKSVPKFEVMMSLPGLYRMSEDGVYPSSVPSSPLWGLSNMKQPVPDPILGVEVVRCSIGAVRGVVQVVKIG